MEFLTKADLDGSKEQPKQLYSTQWLDVIEVNGWTVVDEKEAVVCIPYFKETCKVIFRYEEIPTFKMKNPNIEKYVTIMSETMEAGETLFSLILKNIKQRYAKARTISFNDEAIKITFATLVVDCVTETLLKQTLVVNANSDYL